jgi:hypothetical protein
VLFSTMKLIFFSAKCAVLNRRQNADSGTVLYIKKLEDGTAFPQRTPVSSGGAAQSQQHCAAALVVVELKSAKAVLANPLDSQ